MYCRLSDFSDRILAATESLEERVSVLAAVDRQIVREGRFPISAAADMPTWRTTVRSRSTHRDGGGAAEADSNGGPRRVGMACRPALHGRPNRGQCG